MKLLIGDDSLTQRVMLDAITRKWGFETVLAEDGQQAWDILCKADAPRLVLLDWEMPGLDGPEICRRVRARQDRNPPYILLLTARSDTADIVTGLDAGANDYVQKPFENTELHARLRVGARMLDMQSELNDARAALEFQASHDDLTGMLNRGAIMRALEAALERSRADNRPLQVGLLDIDHFKQINDTHGHPAGDAVLRETAHRLWSTLRADDQVGRYGGEEFLVLVDGESADAPAFCERLRTAIADRPFDCDSVALRVTLSGGFVAVNPEDGGSVSEILAAADRKLYEAKSGGRNCILFEPSAIADKPAERRSAG